MYDQYPPASPWQSGAAAAPPGMTPGMTPGMNPPGMAPPGAYQQQAGAIALTTRYYPLAFLLAAFKPEIAVNGQPVAAGWGRTVIPVPAGQYHLHVHVPYLLPSRIGVADLVVAVQPGQTLELEYRAPVVAFSGGSLGTAPQTYKGMPVLIVLLVLTLLLAVCAGGGAIFAASQQSDDDPWALPAPTASSTAPGGISSAVPPYGGGTPDPSGTDPSGAGQPSPAASGEPILRDLPARTLVGPTYAAGEPTFTMAFTGWPFAFRTPGTWGCMGGRVDLPDAKAWVCLDEQNPRNGQRVNVILRPCPGACGRAERARLSREWFATATTAAATTTSDGRTSYIQTEHDSKGRYVLDVSHFFGTSAGAAPRWQVGVAGIAPPADRAIVQKVINDMLTQTP